MLKPGPTGQFPDGILNPEDQGEMQIAVYHEGGLVHMDFGGDVNWFALLPHQARLLGEVLIERAKRAEQSAQLRKG